MKKHLKSHSLKSLSLVLKFILGISLTFDLPVRSTVQSDCFVYRAAELMTKTGQVVSLKVVKQGAFYHGLATLLSQPSPILPRGQYIITPTSNRGDSES